MAFPLTLAQPRIVGISVCSRTKVEKDLVSRVPESSQWIEDHRSCTKDSTSMVMDTSTVRLVIFLGMFLIFAGDYSYLVSTFFGRTSEKNVTETIKGPDGAAHAVDDRISLTKKNDERENGISRRAKMMTTIKTACLPKLICELTSSVHQDQLSEMERSLLNLIRDTSLNTMAEVPSRYHFAAHMGQLISGLEGQGCHNFYPTCPLPGSSVLSMMKKIRLRWQDEILARRRQKNTTTKPVILQTILSSSNFHRIFILLNLQNFFVETFFARRHQEMVVKMSQIHFAFKYVKTFL